MPEKWGKVYSTDADRFPLSTATDSMNRRTFLAAGVSAGVAVLAGPSLFARPMENLYEISLAQWSLHRTLRSGAMDNLDFADTTRSTFGLSAVEYVNQFFADRAEDRAYLAEMKQRADDAGVRSLLIMIDGEGRLGDPDARMRTEAVENHYRWVAAAKTLGCHSIRVNAYSEGSRDEQMERCADGLHRLAQFADEYDIDVLVENHGGLSSDGQWVAGLMRMADHPRVGTLPDFGNFRLEDGSEYDRYRGVEEMMPFAKAVSAKSHAFDADGNETATDYRRMMQIVLDAGYNGYVGIEYEGSDHSEEEGILLTRDLLLSVRDELSSH